MNFAIKDIFKNAWSQMPGSKGAIWSIAALIILILITFEYLSRQLMTTDSQTLHYWLRYIIVPIIMDLFIGPFYGGSFMVAIKRSRREDINIKTGFQYTHRYLQAAILMAIVGLISNLILILVNIPSISQQIGQALPYFDLIGELFSFAVYSLCLLSIPLALDKNLGIKASLHESIKLIKPHWLPIFLMVLLANIAIFIAMLPPFLGQTFDHGIMTIIGIFLLIIIMTWLFPYLFLLGGNIYHKLVDSSVEPSNEQ